MDGTGDHYVKQNKKYSERQIPNDFSYAESRFFLKDMKVEEGPFGGRGVTGKGRAIEECDGVKMI